MVSVGQDLRGVKRVNPEIKIWNVPFNKNRTYTLKAKIWSHQLNLLLSYKGEGQIHQCLIDVMYTELSNTFRWNIQSFWQHRKY